MFSNAPEKQSLYISVSHHNVIFSLVSISFSNSYIILSFSIESLLNGNPYFSTRFTFLSVKGYIRMDRNPHVNETTLSG